MARVFSGKCFSCGAVLDFPEGNVGRREQCPSCSSDVRVCLNCKFYDVSCYNECKEPQGERVLEKNKSNFCDYFVFVGKEDRPGSQGTKESTIKSLEDLFRK